MSKHIATRHPDASDIGRFASARLGYPSDLSSVRGEGKVVAYCDAPQVLIETADGERFWWRADLTLAHGGAGESR